jgi:GDP-L-fucose synthase
MDSDSKILVCGANGMVGSAIVKNLKEKGHKKVVIGTRSWVDFTKERETRAFFEEVRPEYVFIAAAKVGGIMANKNHKAEFITENLQIQTNTIQQSYLTGVKKLLFLGSSCIYPKFATQPITEDQLMTGPLEPTNDAYALAKIVGLKMCQAYREQYGFNAISLMPTNLYGPNDNFDPKTCHVVPALIKRVLDGEDPFIVWGTADVVRDFLYVKDVVKAALLVLEKGESMRPYNVGSGVAITVGDIVNAILKATGKTPEVIYDASKPTTIPFRMVSTERLNNELGFTPDYTFEEGIKETIEWYIKNIKNA